MSKPAIFLSASSCSKCLSDFFLLFFFSCSGPSKQKVDLIVHHAVVYTVDSVMNISGAFAVKNGKIVEVNTTDSILAKYESDSSLDASGKSVFPGFIDAHCHFLHYGLGLNKVNLVGTTSFNEVIDRMMKYSKEHPDAKWIVGRGWDQNDWKIKEFPSRFQLDSLFPNIPVFLKRVDGHAALVNGEALRRAGITQWKKIEGGEIALRKVIESEKPFPDSSRDNFNVLSGILIDNAVDLVERILPAPTNEEMKQALLEAQKNCFAVGLTTVDDAGLMKNEIDLIDKLQKEHSLKMRIYAMLTDNKENLDYYLKHGPYKTDRLNVRSFKFYADGALGSRGACLLKDYSDKPRWQGFLLNKPEYFQEMANKMFAKGFQMNTHCIGDSANRFLISVYQKAFIPVSGAWNAKSPPKKSIVRWRIEHVQVVSFDDIKKFSPYIIPSIQPTHATSDMYWAGDRLGAERIKYAYAYKELLKAAGMVALGTDFPVEDISPFKTFYAAVARKDDKGWPEGGFQMENALTREETLKGMTAWAAFANFEEHEKGSIEKGKFADFIILDTDIMTCSMNKILSAKVLYTFVNGEKVYELK